MLRYMALTPIVTIDPEKVYALIERQDLPTRVRPGRGSGKKTAFARKIGRRPEVIFNLKNIPVLSVRFATEIAEGLGVPLDAITAAGDGEDQETPPQAGDDEEPEITASAGKRAA